MEKSVYIEKIIKYKGKIKSIENSYQKQLNALKQRHNNQLARYQGLIQKETDNYISEYLVAKHYLVKVGDLLTTRTKYPFLIHDVKIDCENEIAIVELINTKTQKHIFINEKTLRSFYKFKNQNYDKKN